MKVKDAIKELTNFIITKNGKILFINNGNKNFEIEEELLMTEVKSIDEIKGLYADYKCIRV